MPHRYREDVEHLHARVPKSLKGDLKLRAAAHDRSVGSLVRVVLGSWLLRGINGFGPGEVPPESPEGK